jgi:hypothetical protein
MTDIAEESVLSAHLRNQNAIEKKATDGDKYFYWRPRNPG